MKEKNQVESGGGGGGGSATAHSCCVSLGTAKPQLQLQLLRLLHTYRSPLNSDLKIAWALLSCLEKIGVVEGDGVDVGDVVVSGVD